MSWHQSCLMGLMGAPTWAAGGRAGGRASKMVGCGALAPPHPSGGVWGWELRPRSHAPPRLCVRARGGGEGVGIGEGVGGNLRGWGPAAAAQVALCSRQLRGCAGLGLERAGPWLAAPVYFLQRVQLVPSSSGRPSGCPHRQPLGGAPPVISSAGLSPALAPPLGLLGCCPILCIWSGARP